MEAATFLRSTLWVSPVSVHRMTSTRTSNSALLLRCFVRFVLLAVLLHFLLIVMEQTMIVSCDERPNSCLVLLSSFSSFLLLPFLFGSSPSFIDIDRSCNTRLPQTETTPASRTFILRGMTRRRMSRPSYYLLICIAFINNVYHLLASSKRIANSNQYSLYIHGAAGRHPDAWLRLPRVE